MSLDDCPGAVAGLLRAAARLFAVQARAKLFNDSVAHLGQELGEVPDDARLEVACRIGIVLRELEAAETDALDAAEAFRSRCEALTTNGFLSGTDRADYAQAT